MRPRKAVILLGDGMADEPLAQLGNRTPLQAARTPGMDSIARLGRTGTLLTLPEGLPTGSEVANMSVLGCRLPEEYCGRGPIEAAGRELNLNAGDIAFRLNLTTVEDGILKDFSGGHVPRETAEELIDTLNSRFGNRNIKFYPGVSYRCILVFSGPDYSDRINAAKPDDHQGDRISDWLPEAAAPEAELTARFLRRIMNEAGAALEQCPANIALADQRKPMANGVWPWSGGRAGSMDGIADKYGITGAVISAVDVINGLGRCLGMDVIRVPGATGYIDTDYEGKADAAVRALRDHDLVYLHVEAIDEVSHQRNLEAKLRAIEDFDARAVSRVLKAVEPDVSVAVLPDHPVPLSLGKHTRVPVPVAVRMRGVEPDGVQTFDEIACPAGSLGAMKNGDLMSLLFGAPRH